MKITDIVELAKAGYKPKDVLTLLEYVENSPKVAEAEPTTPDEIPTNTPEPAPVTTSTVEEKTDDLETLKNLLQEG